MEVGDQAPDFVLPDQNGEMVRLSAFAPGKTLVVFFYPIDGTPVCVAEATSFRDKLPEFERYNARVVGVSPDSVESHRHFAAVNRLDFPLLSDADGKVRKLWGVPAVLGVVPGRATYVLDSGGVVRHIHSAQLQAAKHVETALDAARAIQAMSGS